MVERPPSRKLATIVAVDVAGYSARTEADETATTTEVAALRIVVGGIATAYGGRVFNSAGDGFMLEFGSSLSAVEAAAALAETCEPRVRIGVHLGDVIVQPDGDLLGHGVNVAARLMAQSAPGQALVSADVRRTIRGPLAGRLVSRGSLQLDKMNETIEAFALLAPVFIAHAPEDLAAAQRIADGLTHEGFAVGVAGNYTNADADRALRDARGVVVLWSPHAAASEQVLAHATLADRNKTLIPVTVLPCQPPLMFQLTRTAGLEHWTGALDDPAWRSIANEVRALARRRAEPMPQAAGAPVAQQRHDDSPIPSLAALPFTNRSGLAEDEVFALGMVEDVIEALSQGVNVRVIASSATLRFRHGAIPDLEAMARQLGVRYLLEGNVRRAGRDLRVTAQLLDASSGTILWTRRFDRPLHELAALQEDLVLEIAASLNVQVFRMEMERALRKPANLTAWEANHRSIAAFREVTPRSIRLSIEEAERAIAAAPDDGLGYANLANALSVIHYFAASEDTDALQRIRATIDKALARDPDGALTLTFCAFALANLGFPTEALRHARNALQLSPRVYMAHFVCGRALTSLHQWDDAIDNLTNELRVAPGGHLEYHVHQWMATAHIGAGRWKEAEDALDRALLLYPNYGVSLMVKAVLCARDGRMVEARDLFIRARASGLETDVAVTERRYRSSWMGHAVAEDLIGHLRALYAQCEPAQAATSH